MELLAIPPGSGPRMLLDLGCGSGLSGEQLTEMVGGPCSLPGEWLMLDRAQVCGVDGMLMLS